MRLICPECAAEYEIADRLVPPEGRDVECSACGHVWRQSGLPPLRLLPDGVMQDAHDIADDDTIGDDAVDDGAAGAPPPLSRGLTDPVLAILREEAARELSARQAERAARSANATVATDTGVPSLDAEALPDPHALAASLEWQVPGRPLPEVTAPQLSVPAPQPRLPADVEARRVAIRQQRSHDRGFTAAMLAAAMLAVVYVAAPAIADRGVASAQLMQAREGADRGRYWLQRRAEGLTDGAIAGLRGLFD